MAELKTRPTDRSVVRFLEAIADDERRADARRLLTLMQRVTRLEPVLWGDSMVGFGTYHYRYASGQEGDWPLVAFSPRKQNLTVYIMPGFAEYGALLKKLGPVKTGKSCLYLPSLDQVHEPALRQLVRQSVAHMKAVVKARTAEGRKKRSRAAGTRH